MTMCFWNGAIVPLDEVAISPYDLGFLRAYAVYEGILAIDGEPFHFDDHYERLRASAHTLHLALPYTSEQLLFAMRELLRQNSFIEGRATVRVLVTGGPAHHGIDYETGNETCIVLAEPAVVHNLRYYEAGGSLMLHEFQRSLPTCKTVEYALPVSLQQERIASGAAEILYHTHGELRECSTANIFIIKNGVIATPNEQVLFGITRKVVIELACELGYRVEERAVMLEELSNADEVFITSSFRDVMPITAVGTIPVADGAVGAITKKIMQAFQEKLR